MPTPIAGLSARTRVLLTVLCVLCVLALTAAGLGLQRVLGSRDATAARPVPAGPRTADRIVPVPVVEPADGDGIALALDPALPAATGAEG
ncbi:hypothetical protein [Kitasatospora purpeofusca]|uniref:hypothetical protein n=1 Tax=Kitasatospora purpeofusca TaxID=67352 RepID=UPI0038700077|nr:hypothetical protein OIP63_32705 [Kitasatospora purpeofusca]